MRLRAEDAFFATPALLFTRGVAAFFFGSLGAAAPVGAALGFADAPASHFCNASTGGLFFFHFSTGSNRSPYFLARANTSSDSNTSKLASPFFRQTSTSSHLTGVETVGRSLARNEYTH